MGKKIIKAIVGLIGSLSYEAYCRGQLALAQGRAEMAEARGSVVRERLYHAQADRLNIESGNLAIGRSALSQLSQVVPGYVQALVRGLSVFNRILDREEKEEKGQGDQEPTADAKSGDACSCGTPETPQGTCVDYGCAAKRHAPLVTPEPRAGAGCYPVPTLGDDVVDLAPVSAVYAIDPDPDLGIGCGQPCNPPRPPKL